MSEVKPSELNSYEIDKSNLRHRTVDTIVATAALNHGEDSLLGVKMEATDESAGKPTDLYLQTATHLVTSVTSSLADTPGDSGVLCLDSEVSEVTGQALMCHSLIGTEELACDSQGDQTPTSSQDMTKSTSSSLLTKSDIDNQNLSDDTVPELLVGSHSKSPIHENLPDVVLKALESEMVITEKPQRPGEPKKSQSEDIVFRRKCRKKSQNASSQKKRVSFHEDILNSTKTDNIHIERGFVSYGPNSSYCDRFRQRNNIQADRYSWCSSGDKAEARAAEMGQQTMSDILTYGDSKTDKSGIFEYQHENEKDSKDNDNNNVEKPIRKLYGCESNSSDSNFSCDSETSSSDSTISNSNSADGVTVNKKDKTQKSYSCDGFENNNHVSIMRKTYFSEADIDKSHDRSSSLLDTPSSPIPVKSVLKKKRYIPTNVVEERKNGKKLNIIDPNNIIGSLKSFYKNFNFKLTPEKGVPETSLDLNNVVEALPSDVNRNKKLCKSLDSGFHVEEDDFVEINLNDQPLDNKKDMNTPQMNPVLGDRTPKEGSPRHKLTLNMKENKPTDSNDLPPIEKYVVNCESMVYEHTGMTYSFVHDTFQTAFDAPKQSFVPPPEATPEQAMTASTSELTLPQMEHETASKTSTPKRQFKNLQDETKGGIPKHLSSPKKQNFSRLRKSAPTVKLNNETSSQQLISDDCSNTDNSTIKGVDDYEDFFDETSNQKLQSNKAVLLNRYLKNVCQRKDMETKVKNNKFLQRKLLLEKGFPIVYPMKLVDPNFREAAARTSRQIDKEVIENKRLSVRMLTAEEPSYFDSFEDNVAIECSEKLRLKIFTYPNETLNRMMKVQSAPNPADGSWTPQLVFITDYALYVATVEPDATEYEIVCQLPHDQLDAIAVGPENQYIQVIDTSGTIVCSIVTAESSLGARLASSLEWSARTSPLRRGSPPACLPLTADVTAVSVARKRAEKKIPTVVYYGRACTGSQEVSCASPGAFAPPLEGYLMVRTDREKRFQPSYFLLRAGVLQWGPQPSSPLPHCLPLRSVVGVRRYCDATRRPHCFQVAPSSGPKVLIAAPDEPTASCWLQCILLHAAQAVECAPPAPAPPRPPPAVTLLVTARQVLALRDSLAPAFVVGAAPYLRDKAAEPVLKEYIKEMNTDVEVVASGSLRNLTAFKIPDTDDNWCCLEWGVCEAVERGCSLPLVFASGAELERFIAAVEKAHSRVTSEPFPLSVVESPLSSANSAQFEAAWRHMLPTH